MKRTACAAIGAAALAVVLAACGSSTPAGSSAPAATTSAAALPPPTPVPPPKGKVVLKLSGTLSNHNAGALLVFDQKTLDAMATTSATLYEPFVKHDIRFTGIPMSSLLGRAGISRAATKVRMHALDDYRVDFQVADLTAPGVLLAVKADGRAIPVAKGGPIRLVFPPQSSVGGNKDLWIWSIDSMAVH
jgi:hypothetical protein